MKLARPGVRRQTPCSRRTHGTLRLEQQEKEDPASVAWAPGCGALNSESLTGKSCRDWGQSRPASRKSQSFEPAPSSSPAEGVRSVSPGSALKGQMHKDRGTAKQHQDCAIHKLQMMWPRGPAVAQKLRGRENEGSKLEDRRTTVSMGFHTDGAPVQKTQGSEHCGGQNRGHSGPVRPRTLVAR